MTKWSGTLNSPGTSAIPAAVLALALCLPGSAALSSPNGAEAAATGINRTGTEAGLRLAQNKVLKYEIPKAPQATPDPPPPPPPPPQTYVPPPPSNPAPTYVPSTPPKSGGSSSFTLFGGSCENCRNGCYVTYHGTSKFVPCMRSCWNRICRRR